MVTCPHDGPTSKGDCLNWIYQRMKDHEARHRMRFRIVVLHDAEDLIHPESLRLINWFSRRYAMVQVPVLPLPTGVGEWTHGLYCDEFAEYQHKDIPVRQHLGGFLPSNGVGTGFDRAALERLAATRSRPSLRSGLPHRGLRNRLPAALARLSPDFRAGAHRAGRTRGHP